VERSTRLLRIAFLAGALTDGLAVVPMLVPEVASLMWGVEKPFGDSILAIGYGVSLMSGWTVLLLWAYQRPNERRAVAGLTILVICGLAVAETIAVFSGSVAASRMAATWLLQTALLVLFALPFCYPVVRDQVKK
jgi:hypothetical protein